MNRKKPTSTKTPVVRPKAEKQFFVQDLNPSEILISFFGFITTRDKPITVSQFHDAAPIAELAKEFMNYHKFPKSRSRVLVTPPFLGENIGMPEQKRAARLYSPEELAHNALDTILSTSTENQNKILRIVIGKVKEGRKANESRISNQIDEASENLKTANEAIQALDMILSGKLDDLDIS